VTSPNTASLIKQKLTERPDAKARKTLPDSLAEPRIFFWLPKRLKKPVRDKSRKAFSELAAGVHETTTWPRCSFDPPDIFADLLQQVFPGPPAIAIVYEAIQKEEFAPYVLWPVDRITEGLPNKPPAFKFSTSGGPQALDNLQGIFERNNVVLVTFHDVNVRAFRISDLHQQLRPKLDEVAKIVDRVHRTRQRQPPVEVVLLTQQRFLKIPEIQNREYSLFDAGGRVCSIVRVERAASGEIQPDPGDIESVKNNLKPFMDALEKRP
jgi:hypothetical protein